MDESISPIEAIRFALKKEEESYRFYSEAAAKTNDPGTRQMFEFLASEEQKHVALLQDKLDKEFLTEM